MHMINSGANDCMFNLYTSAKHLTRCPQFRGLEQWSSTVATCTFYCGSDIIHCHIILLPAVLFFFLPVVLVVVLSICDSLSLSSLSDLESVVNEVFTIQKFGRVESHFSYLHILTVSLTSCNAILPAFLFLFLLAVSVVVLSTCDCCSRSSSSDPISVVRIDLANNSTW